MQTKGGIIYKPKPGSLSGEYGKLGANLYNPGLASGCRAGCLYCNNPHMPVVRMRRDTLQGQEFKPKADILARLRHDCEGKYHDCKTPVVMGFVGDIYQPHDQGDDVTRDALEIMRNNGLVPAVLSKFGSRAVRDFDILKAAGGWFGQTMSGIDPEWEPNAAGNVNRWAAFAEARGYVSRWVSVEPVLRSIAALDTIRAAAGCNDPIDHLKLGKLNGYDAETRAIERAIDWPAYREDARAILNGAGYREITTPGAFEVGTYYVKAELRALVGEAK